MGEELSALNLDIKPNEDGFHALSKKSTKFMSFYLDPEQTRVILNLLA